MRPVNLDIPWIWLQLIGIFIISGALTGQAEARSHIRHRTTPYHRALRADKIKPVKYMNISANTSVRTPSNSNVNTPLRSETLGDLQLFTEQHHLLSLFCDVNINYTNYVWLKDGQIVQTVLVDNAKRSSGHRFLVDNESRLVIDTVRLEDDGSWQCEVEDATGFVVAAKPIRVIVLDPPKKPYLLIDNRILDPGNLFIPVKENSELTVSCVVDGGNPKPTLSWDLSLGSLSLLDSPEIPYHVLNFSEISRETSLGARSDAHLLKILRAHHNATISCIVNHMSLKQPFNVSLLLDVQYTPSFSISREPGFGFPIREGMPVSLKCEVDSNPRAAPIWQKDDTSPPVQQTADGFLNFTAIRREHSGWYKCVARHLLGKFSSIGYFLNIRYEAGDVTSEPDFDIGELSSTGRQMELALGGAVQLQCPEGTIGCWSQISSETRAPQDPRLEKTPYREEAGYKCNIPKDRKESDASQNPHSANIPENGKPVVYPRNQTVAAIDGQHLTLTVEFCTDPLFTKLFWIIDNHVLQVGASNGKMYSPNVTNSSEPNCYNAMLIIQSVSSSDSGEISFLVRSPSGVSEGVFQVNITQASEFTNNNAVSQLSHNAIVASCLTHCMCVYLLSVYFKCQIVST